MMGVTDLLSSDADGNVHSWRVDTHQLEYVVRVLDPASYVFIKTETKSRSHVLVSVSEPHSLSASDRAKRAGFFERQRWSVSDHIF